NSGAAADALAAATTPIANTATSATNTLLNIDLIKQQPFSSSHSAPKPHPQAGRNPDTGLTAQHAHTRRRNRPARTHTWKPTPMHTGRLYPSYASRRAANPHAVGLPAIPGRAIARPA